MVRMESHSFTQLESFTFNLWQVKQDDDVTDTTQVGNDYMDIELKSDKSNVRI